MPRKNQASVLDALTAILRTKTAGTQEDIKQRLEEQGYVANQSKISRLLRKLGAIKITNEQAQIIYSLPHEPAPSNAKNVLSHLIVSIATNEVLIVISTNPGSASLIARLLDHHRNELEILGTVAGDDTLFIAPTSTKQLMHTLDLITSFINEAK